VKYTKYIFMPLYIICSLKCLLWELNDTDLWREPKKIKSKYLIRILFFKF